MLDNGVMDLIRRTLITPKAVREMIDIINEDVRLRCEDQAPELERARRRISSLEKQDEVAAELRQATAQLEGLERVREPMPTTKKFVQQTMDEMTGLIESSALDTRVAWVRDLLDRVTVDGREERVVAIWRTATDDGVTGRIQ